MKRGSEAMIVACGGGKGGVGKSLVAANLGIALARIGMRTVLVDGDLGCANLHTMFGIDHPGATLGALIERKVTTLEEVSIPTREPRLFLIPGTGAVLGAANVAHAQKQKLLGQIRRLDADVIVVDVGAGTSYNALDIFDLGDLRLVVATPQLTSLQNAYAFVKGALFRTLRGCASTDEERALFEGASSRADTERVRDMIARIDQEHPELGARMRAQVSAFSGALVGNQIEHASQRNVFFALARMARDFLGVELPLACELPLEQRMHQSVTVREPYLFGRSSGPIARAFDTLAERVLSTDIAAVRRQRNSERPPEPSKPSAEPSIEGQLSEFLRSEDRVPVDWRSEVCIDGAWSTVRLVDVSPSGALIAAPKAPEIGTRVVVRSPRTGAVTGVVRHTREGYYGIEIDVSNRAQMRMAIVDNRSSISRRALG